MSDTARDQLAAILRPLIGAHADIAANHLAAAGVRTAEQVAQIEGRLAASRELNEFNEWAWAQASRRLHERADRAEAELAEARARLAELHEAAERAMREIDRFAVNQIGTADHGMVTAANRLRVLLGSRCRKCGTRWSAPVDECPECGSSDA